MNSSPRLQEIFFTLIANLFRDASWDDEVYKKVLIQIAAYMKADFAAFYMFYEKTDTYRLIDFTTNKDEYKPLKFLSRSEMLQVDEFVERVAGTDYSSLTSIKLPTRDRFIMIIINEKPISALLVEETVREVKSLLTVLQRMYDNSFNERNNKFLLNLSTKLLNSHDREVILHKIDEALKKLYPNHQYYLLLTQEHDTHIDLPVKPLKYKEGNLHDVSTEVFMTGELQIAEDRIALEKTVFAPLTGEQSVYGVLELRAKIDNYFSDQELSFITEFASLAGKSLEKTILYEDSLLQVSNLTLLNDIIHQLNTKSELSEITLEIRNKITSITNASQIGFIYFDEELNDLSSLLTGSSPYFYKPDGKTLIDSLKNKKNAGNESIFSGNNTELKDYGFQSVMTVPMVNSGQSFGFAVILHEDKYHFTFENFKLIESLIQHAAVVISNTMLKEKLKKAVITDYLTGLYSRSYLEEQITEHINSGNDGVLVLYDIDNFKGVNDRYGHHTGDKVLIQVADILQSEIGDYGISARWGGEELAVYLPELTLEFSLEIAEGIRKRIALETSPSITVSCGIGRWSDGENANQATLFLKADQALYDAKSRGKDRIVIA